MEMTRYDPCDDRFVRTGRHDPKEEECPLWCSASGIRVKLRCTRLDVEIEATECTYMPWIGILVDGAAVARFSLMVGHHRYSVLSGMDPDIEHEITIQRDTPAIDGDTNLIWLRGIYTDGIIGQCEERPLRIEFLGDSLTVGEGCVGPKSAMEWKVIWASNMKAFPTLVSEAMNAERSIVAHGGWGAWRAWNGDPHGKIGRVYEQLCGIVPEGRRAYDFSSHHADIVVINLGTNDGGAVRRAVDMSVEDALVALWKSCVELLRNVRKNEPEALILWVYGMIGDEVRLSIESAVQEVRASGDKKVHFLMVSDCGDQIGAENHPGHNAHVKTAEEIIHFLKQHI